ncbi:MAG: hypothetical protein ACM3KR_04560 [Deltaproteobacteria bacterium]
MKQKLNGELHNKGSVTVEAAIGLPAFICAVLAIAFILKVIYVQELIQHAISEVADEIASCSYIYSAAGLQAIHDTANKGLQEGSQRVESQIRTLVDTYDCFKSFPKNAKQKIDEGVKGISLLDVDGAVDDFDEINQSVENLNKKFEDTKKIADEIADNPRQEIKYIISAFAKQGFEGIKAEVLLKPLTKACLLKYLKAQDEEDINIRLKRLNIDKGFSGLDFNNSKMFYDGKNIEIIVKYNIKAPIPLNIVPKISIVQRVKVRAWLDGEFQDEENIWSLEDFERGRKIQKIYGRNLPYNFKTITKFEYGTATLVTSINLNAATYKNKPQRAISEIKKAVRNLECFDKDSKTRDESGRTIEYYVEAKDINFRRVIIVIPKGSRNESYNRLFEECKKSAKGDNVELIIDEL